MTKKTILSISIIVNIILATVFAVSLPGAMGELVYEYVEQDTIRPDTIRKYLEWENYGTVAALSRPIRGGAEVADTDADYYKLGEYAELLFLKEVYERAGNADSAKACEDRGVRRKWKTPGKWSSVRTAEQNLMCRWFAVRIAMRDMHLPKKKSIWVSWKRSARTWRDIRMTVTKH